MPGIAQSHGAANGAPAVAADPEGDVWLLSRLRLEGDILEARIPPVKCRLVLCPKRFDGGEVFVADRATVLERHAKGLELLLHSDHLHARCDTSAPEHIQTCEH